MNITQEFLDSPIQEYLDQRICNALDRVGVYTMQDLLMCCGRLYNCSICTDQFDCDRVKLLDIKQFGKTSLDKIYARLEELEIIVKRKEPAVPETSRLLVRRAKYESHTSTTVAKKREGRRAPTVLRESANSD